MLSRPAVCIFPAARLRTERAGAICYKVACVTFACSAMLAVSRANAAASPFLRNADGSWTASEPGYTARVDASGYLSSVRINGVEALGAPFSYQPDAKLAADQVTTGDDTIKVHLKGGGEAEIDYVFGPAGFSIIPTWKGGGYGQFRFTASPALLGIELLNYKGNTAGGEATRFVGNGEIRGVPAVSSSRNQMVRFHYPGFRLRAFVQAWGAPFNYESAGQVQGYTWGRPLLDANRPFPIIFSIERTAPGPRLAALPFVPRTEKVASLYYTDERCDWEIDPGDRKAYRYLTDAGIRALHLDWTLLDIHDLPAAHGSARVALDAVSGDARRTVTLEPPGSGYYSAIFRLTDPSGRMLPSSFRTRFTVIHRVPGMVNRDDSLKHGPISDYAVMGMIGAGAIRESHNMDEFFTNHEPSGEGWVKVPGADPPVWMNTASLDRLFDTATGESGKHHQTWFFQANSRPAYATPAVYQAMAEALVSREKSRCRVWEVENEPNFRYSPANYVEQCLIPFAKGAKAADPGCVVMGPGCVSLKQTLEFMDTIYKSGANRWLDNISTHSYPGPGESWEQFGNTSTIPELRRWMVQHGDGAKAIWQTEQGYAWDNSGKGQSARYVVRQFLEGARLGIPPDHQYYFYPQWHGFEDWYLEGSGEAGSEQSWLPGGAALRFFAENLHGMSYAGDIRSPYKGIELARFSGHEENVVAAWTFDFDERLPVRISGLKRVSDYMGNPLVLQRDARGQLVLPLSGEPIYIHLARTGHLETSERYGPNWALASAGAVASASSADVKKPASNANDGNWQLWEDVIGLPGRTAWQSGRMDPSPQNPDWLQVSFPAPRVIDRVVALCYLPAVNASPREYEIQAQVRGGWRTVAAASGVSTWIINRTFSPVKTGAIRFVVRGINDGWQGDHRWMPILMGPGATHYTDSKVLVSEVEAYGPPGQG